MLAHALAFRERSAVRRSILVDDLAGPAHRACSALPNVTCVVDRAGRETFRSNRREAVSSKYGRGGQATSAVRPPVTAWPTG
jgi:hypothetical protein